MSVIKYAYLTGQYNRTIKQLYIKTESQKINTVRSSNWFQTWF